MSLMLPIRDHIIVVDNRAWVDASDEISDTFLLLVKIFQMSSRVCIVASNSPQEADIMA